MAANILSLNLFKKNIDIVNHLKRLGNKIILYTARIEAVINTVNNYNEAMSLYGKEEDVTDAQTDITALTYMQLRDWGVEHDDINWTKPESNYIIDDKMITLDEAMKV